ncbi:MAG: glycine--tRNA ligase [Candidatus Nanoarchaeia archaeon]|jgi:glycyl-tRNA synthetase|nr:glycine--tRNA ligase [Candidatus Nanoarchaeia archaeon]|tara:strand:- start:2675 stop:4186 length:1512 start_codon:yes stop_codon:yes gene_type:complete
MNNDFLKDFISFVVEKGFIWGPEPEIYGGMAGFYTYGPLGKLLKNKVENSVRSIFKSNDIWELEGPTILPDIVWKASGHLDTFYDPIIECSKCKAKFRADHLLEEKGVEGITNNKEILKLMKQKKIKCPNCKGDFKHEIKDESLMMKTKVSGEDASLRPETATVTYLPYKRNYMFFRKKLPFGVFQIGKAYRNEISPRQHVIRGREFTQAEAQIIIDPKEKDNWPEYNKIKNLKLPMWDYKSQKKKKDPSLISLDSLIKSKLIKTKAYAWCLWLAYQQFISMGIPKSNIRIRQHNLDEKAFYADDAWDIEIKLRSFGWTEVCGVHDRTDYDLSKHGEHSKENLEATREDGSKFTPHILEIAFGTDRPVFSLLDTFYEKKEKKDGKTMFKLPYHLTPIDLMIFPLVKKNNLIKIAKEIKNDLDKNFVCVYDDVASVGKRYFRAAEVGTPYCITIDFDSIKNKDVTIRDRDTEKQIRVKIKDLKEIINKLLDNEVKFEKAGKIVR